MVLLFPLSLYPASSLVCGGGGWHGNSILWHSQVAIVTCLYSTGPVVASGMCSALREFFYSDLLYGT